MVTRLAAVFTHPIQYFAPLFRALAADRGLVVRVFYCGDRGARASFDREFGERIAWDVPLLEGYDWELLAARRPAREIGVLSVDNPQVCERLAAFGADAVWIHGYAHLTHLRAWRWARRAGRPVILSGDSELLHRRPAATRCLKRLVLPPFFRRIAAFVDFGRHNRDYYRHYGVPAEKMIAGGYPLDVGRFQRERAGMTAAGRAVLRRRFGLEEGALVVLWAGKLIPAKRPLDLVEALSACGGVRRPVQALFVGSGPLRGAVERRVAALGLGGMVRFAGFVNQTEIPRVLALGDVVAMTSEKEPYGLAIPEAMAVGNAVVASDRVGCVSADGVARPGVNALVYPWGDVGALAAALSGLAADDERLRLMQAASLELCGLQDVSRMAQAVGAAARRVHERPAAESAAPGPAPGTG